MKKESRCNRHLNKRFHQKLNPSEDEAMNSSTTSIVIIMKVLEVKKSSGKSVFMK